MDLNQARQVRVASLYLRGLSQVEIQHALASNGLHCDLDTVCADIAFLETVWTTEIKVGPRHKARVLAELREARRAAWAAQDINQVLNSLKIEAELLHLQSLL